MILQLTGPLLAGRTSVPSTPRPQDRGGGEAASQHQGERQEAGRAASLHGERPQTIRSRISRSYWNSTVVEPKSTYWALLAWLYSSSPLCGSLLQYEAILKISKMLLRAGVDANKQDRFGSTYLLVATVKQNFAMISLWLKPQGRPIHCSTSHPRVL